MTTKMTRTGKPRRTELHKFVVKWIEHDRMYFRWFKRDAAACDFAQSLEDKGLQTRVMMK